MSIISEALMQAKKEKANIESKGCVRKIKPKRASTALPLTIFAIIIFLLSIPLIYRYADYFTDVKNQFDPIISIAGAPSLQAKTVPSAITSNLGNAQFAIENSQNRFGPTSGQTSTIASNFNLQGIVEASDSFHAILNGKIVTIGSEVGEAKILYISKKEVLLDTAEGEVTISLPI